MVMVVVLLWGRDQSMVRAMPIGRVAHLAMAHAVSTGTAAGLLLQGRDLIERQNKRLAELEDRNASLVEQLAEVDRERQRLAARVAELERENLSMSSVLVGGGT